MCQKFSETVKFYYTSAVSMVSPTLSCFSSSSFEDVTALKKRPKLHLPTNLPFSLHTCRREVGQQKIVCLSGKSWTNFVGQHLLANFVARLSPALDCHQRVSVNDFFQCVARKNKNSVLNTHIA